MSMFHKVFFYAAANRIPATFNSGYRLRLFAARGFIPDIATTARIAPNVYLGSQLCMGIRSGFGAGSIVLGGGSVIIGDRVRMGPQCLFVTGDHVVPHAGQTFDQSGSLTSTIEVGDDVFLGVRVTLMGGVRVGNGAAIGAGAVVTKDVAEGAVVGGVPAREIYRRAL